MQEREIDLLDLMVGVLLRWRMIIAWMLIGGTLLGALSYVRSTKSVAEQKLTMEQRQDVQTELMALEESLTAVQKNSVRAVINNEKFSEYYNKSLLMKIDAANVPKMEMSFRITSRDMEKSYSITRIYENIISCGLFQWITDRNVDSTSLVGVSELVTVGSGQHNTVGSIGTSNSTVFQGREFDADSFNVTVVHVTEEECRELAQQVVEYLDEQYDQLVKQLGEYDIQLVSQSFAYVTDIELLNQQKAMLNNILAGNANAENLQKEFTEAQQRYFTLLKNGSEDDSLEERTEQNALVAIPTPTVSTKFVFLGMILFAFIYVIYLFMKYILNSKLRATDDLKQLYSLPQLGYIPQAESKKKPFAFVDGWILKLRDHNKRIFSEEEATGLATVAVKMQAKKEDLEAVYCIGCNLKEKSLQVAEQMQTTLKEDGISITILNNVLYNQESMEQLQGAKAVFLLEKAGETLYDEIVQELELLQRQGIKVLGAVVVE